MVDPSSLPPRTDSRPSSPAPSLHSDQAPLRRWDLFCRVIDNFGDIGVSLRLARDLAQRGEQVRLWCDDLSALRWMQPTPVPGLACLPWTLSEQVTADEVGDVVIETFGCELPPAFVAAMAQRSQQSKQTQPMHQMHQGQPPLPPATHPPVWINLEYLSAEDYVERSHGLKSPQFSGPGAGLDKWFFYPGFTARTGGLLLEPRLLHDATRHHGVEWLSARGWAPSADERVLSLFAYPNAPVEALLDALPGNWLLLLCPGEAQRTVPPLVRPGQRAIALPYLSQDDYDRLLWSCDFNLVRGEDSFVRALWAGRPMLWHIYHQHDGAHAPKLDAYLDRSLRHAPANLRQGWSALARAWNGLGAWDPSVRDALERLPDMAAPALQWRAELGAQADLTTQLQAFTGNSR